MPESISNKSIKFVEDLVAVESITSKRSLIPDIKYKQPTACTASLLKSNIRDFDDALKNPLRYVHLFLLHTLLSKKHPPLNEGLALMNPVFCPTSSTYQKHLKLGQCLEIDDRRSLSKFGDVT